MRAEGLSPREFHPLGLYRPLFGLQRLYRVHLFANGESVGEDGQLRVELLLILREIDEYYQRRIDLQEWHVCASKET